jgi:apolipoprotein N-acyltransferase
VPVLNSRILGFVAAAASGLLLFAAGEPLGWGPLAWIALVPLFVVVLRAPRWGWAWLYGFVFGLVYFAVEISWIFIFGWMAWTALVVVLALYGSIATLLTGVLRRHALAPLVAAGAWAGAELLRDRWPFGGYSWGAAGTTQGSVPGVRYLAGTVGTYGLGLLIAFVAAFVAHRIASGGWSLKSLAVVGVALVAFAAIDAAMFSSPPTGRPLRLAVVQGGVPRPARPDQRDAILQSHIALTTRLLSRERPVDVVLWPEDAVGIGVSPGGFERVQALARDLRTPFIVGHSVLSRDSRFLNLVQHIDASGRLVETYQKRHPVPFGEYVPIPFFRRFVGTLQNEVPDDLAAGKRANVFEVGPSKIATPICFESVFPRDILDFARNGADLYVVSTNNASFERSYASQQHIAHGRMRALETRQWLVQDALAGISAEISPDGSISHATQLFTADAFVATVVVRPSASLYAKTGDLFPALGAIVTLIALVFYAVRRPARLST